MVEQCTFDINCFSLYASNLGSHKLRMVERAPKPITMFVEVDGSNPSEFSCYVFTIRIGVFILVHLCKSNEIDLFVGEYS